jgi:aminomethyltransferase
LFLVVNASGRERDATHQRDGLGAAHPVELLEDRALLALQGPAAAEILARHAPEAPRLRFMEAAELAVAGIPCWVSRSGYTGEDGFEISVPAEQAEDLARRLLAEPEVKPIGLGARDSLRLEAGLCLYGHDIDETTTPVEAGLTWTIGMRRKLERGFPGEAIIMEQLFEGAPRRRVGIRPEGRAPVREGAAIFDTDGAEIGRVTSGTFGPSVGGPVAMGYVLPSFAEDGTLLHLELRGRKIGAEVAPLPFTPHRYVRSGPMGEG